MGARRFPRRSRGPSRLRDESPPVARGRPWSGGLLLALAWIGAAALVGCGQVLPGRGAGTGGGRGVLLIAIDSLRADRLSSLGYDRETTPALDRLAAEGVSFQQAFSTAPWLLPAHVSLLSGCDPYVALRYLPENIPPSVVTLWNLPRTAPHLAKEFLRSGYSTVAFADHPWVSPTQGLDSGFQDFYECRLTAGTQPEDVGVERLAGSLESWLQERPAAADWFAYVHLHDLERAWRQVDSRWDTYFEPRPGLDRVPPIGATDHVFHAIPRRRWRGGIFTLGQYEALYDGAVRRVDERLGRLFSRLEQIGRWNNTTVVVVGTHGVGLGEGGVYLDHGMLNDVDLHVPLILRPGEDLRCERGLRTRALASLLDVAPTLLDLHGIASPVEMQGVSQARVLRTRGPAVQGTDAPRAHVVARCGFQAGLAVIDATHCYERTMPWAVRSSDLAVSWYGVQAPRDKLEREVLHDRATDDVGHERSPAASDSERAARLGAVGEAWAAATEDLRQRLQDVTWPEPPSPSWMDEQFVAGASAGSPP